ncbi:MAG: ATP-binding protein [Kiritimatiellia bacterium]
MYIDRRIDRALAEWAEDDSHKPLLLRGARQIGKTTAVRHLAERFDNFIEINFETDRKIGAIFDGDFKMSRILSAIEAYTGSHITPGRTLLFLDEIQECPRAISALRYFYEDVQPLHVVATGSLLEFAFGEISDFGVGRVRNLFMHPLSFSEFMCAMGAEVTMDYASRASFREPLPPPVHEKMLGRLKEFMIVGGMPAAVAEYAKTESFLRAREQQMDILATLKSDFDKYKTRVSPDTIRATFASIVRQTGEKFSYSGSQSETSCAQAKTCVGLLERARIALRIQGCMANGIPIGGDENRKLAKFMILDTGLYLCESGLDIAEWVVDKPARFVNRGRLAEMHAGLELLKSGNPMEDRGLHYWHREAKNANAEVDYIVQYRNGILPIEVKSGVRGSMRSLRILMAEKRLSLGVRTSEENLGLLGDVRIIPLYLIGGHESLLRANGDDGNAS